ncbi:hypothetical protein EON63_01085 [archaeon]|nr:MAG: hypothetical protein EON63_01085 [archaeon]
MPPPDDASRQSILQLELSKLPLQGDIDSRKLVQMSKGYSGAEMVSICNDAALQAIESNADYVTDDMLTTACKKITPQITKDMISFYENFRSKNRTF